MLERAKQDSPPAQVVPRPPAALDGDWTSLCPSCPATFPPAATSSTTACRWYGGLRPAAVPLQHLQGEGVGLYLAMSCPHLPRLAEIMEGLVRHQEHQDLVLGSELQGAVQPSPL